MSRFRPTAGGFARRAAGCWSSPAATATRRPGAPTRCYAPCGLCGRRRRGRAADAAPQVGDPDQAHALARRLGGWPLALRAAGRASPNPPPATTTFDAYRAALDTTLGDTLAPAHNGQLTDQQRRKLLRYTWEISLDQLAQEGHRLARPLLRMLSLTADAPLPRSLITPPLLSVVDGEVSVPALDAALAGLDRYGLIVTPPPERTRRIPCVAMHPLVREINTVLLAEETDPVPWREALGAQLLVEADHTAEAGRAGWDHAHLLAPHLCQIPTLRDATFQTIQPARDTLDRVASALRAAGNAASRLLLRRAVLDAEILTLGLDHPATLTSRNNLAVALAELAEYGQAAELHRRTLTDRERVLGPDHPDTLTSRNNLAETLGELGEYGQAAELHRQTLTDYESVLGPDHPDTLTSRSNLAATLAGLGEYGQAAELHRQTLTDRERVLGLDHPDTLTSRNNLAATLGELGEYGQAADVHWRTLTDRERVLGLDHPDTLHSRNNLAAALRGLGEYGQAADVHRQTLTDYERVLGPDHPDTLISRNNLAVALYGLGEYGQAAELLRRTLTDRERVLGSNHPDTLDSRNSLAKALEALAQRRRWWRR